MIGENAGYVVCCCRRLVLLPRLRALGRDIHERSLELIRSRDNLRSSRAGHPESQGASDALGLVQSKLQDDLKRAKVYEVGLPRGTVWDPETAHRLLEHLVALFGARLVLRILATSQKVVWQIVDCFVLLEDTSLVPQAVRSIYPEVEVLVSSYETLPVVDPFGRLLLLCKLENNFFAPIRSVMEIKGTDPLSVLVQSMAELEEGERFIYTLCFAGLTSEKTIKAARKKTVQSEWGIFFRFMIQGLLKVSGQVMSGTGRTRKGKFRPELQALYEEKLYDQQLVDGYVLLQKDTVGDNNERLLRIVNPVEILSMQLGSDHNGFIPLQADDALRHPSKEVNILNSVDWVDSAEAESITSAMGVLGGLVEETDDRWTRVRAALSIEEAAALWHLPHQGFDSIAIAWTPTRKPAPALLVSNKEGVLIGHNVYAGGRTPIRLPDKSRETHLNIVGRTGVGKSTLMHNLIHHDIKAGKGVGVVDPHGRLVTDILRESIPDERIDDVVVIDIANEEHPPPLNPLIVPGERDYVAVGQVVAVIDKIYDIRAQRAEDAMTAAMLTLWQEKTPTVRDVVKLFTDLEYRARVKGRVEDLVAREFWEEFEGQPPSVQRDLSRPVIHRMRHFYRNPTLYPMMCYPGTLDFAKLIAEAKIILISLGVDETKVPPAEQQLLGAVLVSQLQMAAMAPVEKKSPFSLFIDEVQNFVTTSLDKVLTESRKYGVSLTIANQYLGQLKGAILESVVGTVGATIVFQLGLNDAKLLAPYFKPEFSAEDLINLDLYQTAIKVRSGAGQTLSAFSLETLPPPVGQATGSASEREQRIRERSIELYTPLTRQQVLAWLEKRYPRPRSGAAAKATEEPGTDDWFVT